MAALIQRSFAKGEISPSFQARADLIAYATGLKGSLNGCIKSDGGWINRAGTRVSASTKNDGVARQVPWKFNSSDQTCMLEFGDEYMRIHRNGSPVLVGTPAAWSAVQGYVVGDLVKIGGVNYRCILANLNQ